MKDFLKILFSGQNAMAMIFSLGFLGLGIWMLNDSSEEGGGLMIGAGTVGLIFIIVTTIVNYKKYGK